MGRTESQGPPRNPPLARFGFRACWWSAPLGRGENPGSWWPRKELMVDFTGDDILIYIIYMDDFPSYKKGDCSASHIWLLVSTVCWSFLWYWPSIYQSYVVPYCWGYLMYKCGNWHLLLNQKKVGYAWLCTIVGWSCTKTIPLTSCYSIVWSHSFTLW